MTQQPSPPEPPAGAPQPARASAPSGKNPLGLWAMITAIVGFVFACIPGALIVGWVLLPVGFILGIVAVTRKERRKGTAVIAIVLSVVGTIVGVVVFLTLAADSFSDAFDEASGGETAVVTNDATTNAEAKPDSPAVDDGATAEQQDEPAATGTRDNPAAFGDTVSNDDWTVVLTGFNADADAEVAEANQFNDPAGDGTRWITVDVAATHTAASTEPGNVMELSIDYVAADGTVVGTYDSSASGLEPEFDSFAELYEGATEDGRIGFLVPDSVDGLIRVTPGLFADPVFFALPAS